MIPTQKKTQEELAALREDYGSLQNPNIQPAPLEEQPKPPISQEFIGQAPKWTPQQSQTSPAEARPKQRTRHSLRRNELPLAPGFEVQNKTKIPQERRTSEDIAELRERQELADFRSMPKNPIAYLEQLSAHPVLLTIAYLIAFTAIFAAWKTVYFVTPISLIFVSGLLTAYIFWKKKRSRHHAAILFIILVMTLVFGGIHYAPFFASYAT
jgi:hypothetical protein